MPEIILVVGVGRPEQAGLADLGHSLTRPQACSLSVGDRVLGDQTLLVADIEDLGALVGPDDLFAEVGPMDLEEELQDVPVGAQPKEQH